VEGAEFVIRQFKHATVGGHRYSRTVTDTATDEFLQAAIDRESADRLEAHGLRLALVNTSDADELASWLRAENRGFHEPSHGDALEFQLPRIARRRTTGVWDDSAAQPETPVATVGAWPAELTVPGGSSVTAWAITAVTVAPTHRRLGIARAMLEAELRTAAALGVPVAALNVSEATIYGRYGFGPAAFLADWTVDTRRAAWIGPRPSGRVHFVSPEDLLVDGLELVERVRLETPGQMAFDGILWERLLGFDGGTDSAKHPRVVRYDDAEGEPQGFAVYRVTDTGGDFRKYSVELGFFVAATDDAYAGLWRFLLELDLVGTIKAPLRAVDEPVAWQVADPRAVTRTAVRDHLWVRVLDVPAALSARTYRSAGHIVLDVTDELGFADGLFLLSIAGDGTAVVESLDGEAPADAAAIALTVADLGSLYLGGVSALTLARAGRLTELRPGSAAAVDDAFRSVVAPWLSIWF
jgi:predicted acetyltransferase